MPTGWSMGGIAFYALGLLQIDRGYTIDSSRNKFWAMVNTAQISQALGEPDNDFQRIDYIFHTAPAGAQTTFEVVYSNVLADNPLLKTEFNEPVLPTGFVPVEADLSDHFPLFALIKVSDPRIANSGVLPVLCYSSNGSYLFSTAVVPRSASSRVAVRRRTLFCASELWQCRSHVRLCQSAGPNPTPAQRRP